MWPVTLSTVLRREFALPSANPNDGIPSLLALIHGQSISRRRTMRRSSSLVFFGLAGGLLVLGVSCGRSELDDATTSSEPSPKDAGSASGGPDTAPLPISTSTGTGVAVIPDAAVPVDTALPPITDTGSGRGSSTVTFTSRGTGGAGRRPLAAQESEPSTAAAEIPTEVRVA